jgi:hypothetical protein
MKQVLKFVRVYIYVCFFLQGKLNELYIFRDHYFENHSLDKASKKNSDVENEMKNTLKFFDDLEGMYVQSLDVL